MATKKITENPKETAPKKKRSLSTAPAFQCSLKFETAASLQHLMCAQYVHAQQAAEEGHPILLECFETVNKLFMALTDYLDKNS